ncbi:MAG: hypothetical protein JRG94_13465 [Deltaproteobacteria bacterium]|nr:hypothetical protein [Deltaproteobacteria bacterium]
MTSNWIVSPVAIVEVPEEEVRNELVTDEAELTDGRIAAIVTATGSHHRIEREHVISISSAV